MNYQYYCEKAYIVVRKRLECHRISNEDQIELNERKHKSATQPGSTPFRRAHLGAQLSPVNKTKQVVSIVGGDEQT